jgi:hypothetical protein
MEKSLPPARDYISMTTVGSSHRQEREEKSKTLIQKLSIARRILKL